MQYWSGYILIGAVGVVVWCDVTTLTSPTCHLGTLQTSLLGESLEAPTFSHYFERDPNFANLPMKGSQILTNVADENLKVSTPPSDDFWMVPYPVYLFIAKLPAWFRFWQNLGSTLLEYGQSMDAAPLPKNGKICIPPPQILHCQ